MSTLSTIYWSALAEQIVGRLTVEMEASGRHVHLSRADLEALFGPGYRLNRVKDLSQPGQFACAERVTLEGPKGIMHNVVVLGPEREESQVEISLTDGVALGITPPVRLSGDIAGTPGDHPPPRRPGAAAGPGADRRQAAHPHDPRRTPPASEWRTARRCACSAFTARPVVLEDVEVRVSPKFSTAVHIDYDEANACGFKRATGD